jgi:hypothetical protein
MVGVINVKPGANSFSAFQAAAAKAATVDVSDASSAVVRYLTGN